MFDRPLAAAFQSILEHPQSVTKDEVAKFLAAQNIDEIVEKHEIFYMLSAYQDVPAKVLEVKDVQQNMNVNYYHGMRNEKPFSHCGEDDEIIILYRLALLFNEEKVANQIQEKMILKLKTEISAIAVDDICPDLDVKRAAFVAFAMNCHDKIFETLYSKCNEVLDYYVKDNKRSQPFYCLLSSMHDGRLLDKNFIQNVIPAIKNFGPHENWYFLILNEMDKVDPKAISDKDRKEYVLRYFKHFAESKKSFCMFNDQFFIEGLLSSALSKDKEILELFVKHYQVDLYYPEMLKGLQTEYFDKMEDWQKDMIKEISFARANNWYPEDMQQFSMFNQKDSPFKNVVAEEKEGLKKTV